MVRAIAGTRPTAAIHRHRAHLSSSRTRALGEAASALHSMAILQVFQAKLRQSLDGGVADADVIKDLRSATDLALMATKRSTQAIGRSMGFMVVLNRHLWLTLADLKDADRKTLQSLPPASLVTPWSQSRSVCPRRRSVRKR